MKKDTDKSETAADDSDSELAKDDDDDHLLDDHDDDLDVEDDVTFAEDDDDDDEAAAGDDEKANGKEAAGEETPVKSDEAAAAKVPVAAKKVAKKEGGDTVASVDVVPAEAADKEGASKATDTEDESDKVDDGVKEPVAVKKAAPAELTSPDKRRSILPPKTYIKLKCVHCNIPIRTFNVSPPKPGRCCSRPQVQPHNLNLCFPSLCQIALQTHSVVHQTSADAQPQAHPERSPKRAAAEAALNAQGDAHPTATRGTQHGRVGRT